MLPAFGSQFVFRFQQGTLETLCRSYLSSRDSEDSKLRERVAKDAVVAFDIILEVLASVYMLEPFTPSEVRDRRPHRACGVFCPVLRRLLGLYRRRAHTLLLLLEADSGGAGRFCGVPSLLASVFLQPFLSLQGRFPVDCANVAIPLTVLPTRVRVCRTLLCFYSAARRLPTVSTCLSLY